jgi:hypothetical protein
MSCATSVFGNPVFQRNMYVHGTELGVSDGCPELVMTKPAHERNEFKSRYKDWNYARIVASIA